MKKPILAILAAILAAILLSVACGRSEPRRLELYPSPTWEPTQTERVVVYTSTPLETYTPIVKIVTETPSPEYLCVTAIENVYLRPSPGTDNYPITPLPLGARLTDLGGRDENTDGVWAFVNFGRKRGWVNLSFAEQCK